MENSLVTYGFNKDRKRIEHLKWINSAQSSGKKRYLILARIKFYPEIYSKKCNHTHLRNIVRNIRERETFCSANKQHTYMTEVGGTLPEIPAIITVKEKLFQGGFPLRFPPSCQIL